MRLLLITTGFAMICSTSWVEARYEPTSAPYVAQLHTQEQPVHTRYAGVWTNPYNKGRGHYPGDNSWDRYPSGE